MVLSGKANDDGRRFGLQGNSCGTGLMSERQAWAENGVVKLTAAELARIDGRVLLGNGRELSKLRPRERCAGLPLAEAMGVLKDVDHLFCGTGCIRLVHLKRSQQGQGESDDQHAVSPRATRRAAETSFACKSRTIC